MTLPFCIPTSHVHLIQFFYNLASIQGCQYVLVLALQIGMEWVRGCEFSLYFLRSQWCGILVFFSGAHTPSVYSYCGRVCACPLFLLHTLGMSGLHRSLQSEASFYSPIRISHWADVLGIGVQCIAFVSWSLLLASSPKETLPGLYFSLHFEEFYRFLSYILLPYQFEFIFYIKSQTFSGVLFFCSVICWESSFLLLILLHFTQNQRVILCWSLWGPLKNSIRQFVHIVFPWVGFAMQYSLSSNPPSSCLSLHVSRTMCMYDGTWWC